jgi:hypothetical protein
MPGAGPSARRCWKKITLTQFKKAQEWLAKVDAIKRAEGLAEDDGGQAPLDAMAAAPQRKRFDKIEVKIDDGVLRVEGVRRISEGAGPGRQLHLLHAGRCGGAGEAAQWRASARP